MQRWMIRCICSILFRSCIPRRLWEGRHGSKLCHTLPRLEELDRGLYAGAIGWFNHLNEGEMLVGIRSALIEGREAKLYAGAGIVEGSDPEKETRETEIKLSALLDVFTSEST